MDNTHDGCRRKERLSKRLARNERVRNLEDVYSRFFSVRFRFTGLLRGAIQLPSGSVDLPPRHWHFKTAQYFKSFMDRILCMFPVLVNNSNPCLHFPRESLQVRVSSLQSRMQQPVGFTGRLFDFSGLQPSFAYSELSA